MNIVMQVGHLNANMGEDWIKPMTGAPEEQVKNKAITFRCAEILRLRGINVTVTDANGYNDSVIIGRDWDLFLAVHCDADSSATSAGFTDYPDPTTDGATQKSQAMADKIAFKFFPESGIVYRPERRGNPNVRFYYFWKYLSTMTPCVLIEMGESIDPHDRVILQDTERCAVALARGVCNALDVAYDIAPPYVPPIQPPNPPPIVIPPVPDCCGELTQAKLKLDMIKSITFGKGYWWTRLNKIKALFV